MPAPATFEDSATLRRAKSTSSVPRRVPLPPKASGYGAEYHEHAITAAHLAFERAKSARIADEDRPKLSQSTSRRSLGRHRPSGEGSHLSRRSSRIGANADHWPGSRLARHRTQKAETTTLVVATSPKAPSDDVFSISSPQHRLAERFDGYGVPVSSRLRKAKSTYGYRTDDKIDSDVSPSLSRRLTVAAPAAKDDQSDDAIIALARDKYLNDHQMRPLRKRSSIFAPLLGKSRKSKRDSMIMNEAINRSNAGSETKGPETSALQHVRSQHTDHRGAITSREDPPEAQTRKKSASLSSLAKGWKRAFGRSSRSSSGTTDIPPQHVVSQSRRHNQTLTPTGTSDENQWGQSVQHEWSSVPPLPPPHLVDVRRLFEPLMDDTTLVEDYSSAIASNSRVTSWRDSTRQNTIMTNDLDHLPSIQESPESRRMSGFVGPSNDEGHYQRPSVSTRGNNCRFNFEGAVSGKRLASALMRHTRSNTEEQSLGRDCVADTSRKASETSQPSTVRQLESNTDHPPVPHSYNMSSSIRDVSAELPFGYYFEDDFPSDRPVTPVESRDGLASPSVYSDHINYNTARVHEDTPTRALSSTGMATVMDSGAVARWSLDESRKEHRHSTSNDWRNWAAGETSALGGRVSFSIPAFTETISHTSMNPAQSWASRSDEDTEDRSSSSSESPERINGPSKELKEADLFQSPRLWQPTTSQNSRIRRKPIQSNASPQVAGSDTNFQASRGFAQRQRPVHREPSNVDLLSKGKEDAPAAKQSLVRKASRGISRLPRLSSFSRRASKNDTPPPNQEARALDENFLLRIRKGPYNASTNSFARTPTSSKDEINIAKRSPAAFGNENTPPSSRGQRMADDFLSKRQRLRKTPDNSSSPAFV